MQALKTSGALCTALDLMMSEGHKVIRQCPKEGWEDGEGSVGKKVGVAEVPGFVWLRVEEMRGGLMAAYGRAALSSAL